MPLKLTVDEPPSLNLTSMIDILFLLIIFFMTGTKFAEMERNIGLKVPEVSGAKQSPTAPARVAVNVYRDGTVTLDREQIDVSQLTPRLQEMCHQNPALTVIVRGDAEGTFQNVASVLAACREAGVADMGVTVRVAQGKSDTTR